MILALAGVAQWIGTGLQTKGSLVQIPSQGTHLDCRLGPPQGMRKKQLHIDVSLPLSPSLPLYLKINKIFLKM